MLIGVGVSFFTGFQNPADLDQDLLSPPIASLFHIQTKPRANNVHGITNFGLELDDEKSQAESTKSSKTWRTATIRYQLYIEKWFWEPEGCSEWWIITLENRAGTFQRARLKRSSS